MREPLKFEELRTLQAAETVADAVWRRVVKWEPFVREVVGGQLARAREPTVQYDTAHSDSLPMPAAIQALMALESITEWSADAQAPLFGEAELARLPTIPNT